MLSIFQPVDESKDGALAQESVAICSVFSVTMLASVQTSMRRTAINEQTKGSTVYFVAQPTNVDDIPVHFSGR